MTIRPERPSEFPLLYEFIQTAFATAAVSDGTEQDFTDRLRAGGGYIPELALVAEEDGAIVGHIMLTRTPLQTDSAEYDTLLLAPLSVALSHRSQGVGSALVKAACDKARAGLHRRVSCRRPGLLQPFRFCGRFAVWHCLQRRHSRAICAGLRAGA